MTQPRLQNLDGISSSHGCPKLLLVIGDWRQMVTKHLPVSAQNCPKRSCFILRKWAIKSNQRNERVWQSANFLYFKIVSNLSSLAQARSAPKPCPQFFSDG